MYSWMRLTWMSNIADRDRACQAHVVLWMSLGEFELCCSRLTAEQLLLKLDIVRQMAGEPDLRSSGCRRGTCPRRPRLTNLRDVRRRDWHCISQRRGVMPLVLLLIRSGIELVQVGANTVTFISSVCSADTPLIECEPMQRRDCPCERGARRFSSISEIELIWPLVRHFFSASRRASTSKLGIDRRR